jgi:hypothetical protein
MKIDWAMLREQKQWLLNFNDEQAAGLVYLLDALQDQAVESGELTETEVFGQE